MIPKWHGMLRLILESCQNNLMLGNVVKSYFNKKHTCSLFQDIYFLQNLMTPAR